MRKAGLVLLMAVVVMMSFAAGQTTLDKALEAQLRKEFPNATAFSPKQASPLPHYVAYTGNPGSQTVAGEVFWTTEWEQLERGYDGPIRILVRLATNSPLTGYLLT